jgi:hypothetical protein
MPGNASVRCWLLAFGCPKRRHGLMPSPDGERRTTRQGTRARRANRHDRGCARSPFEIGLNGLGDAPHGRHKPYNAMDDGRAGVAVSSSMNKD